MKFVAFLYTIYKKSRYTIPTEIHNCCHVTADVGIFLLQVSVYNWKWYHIYSYV